MRIRIIGWIVVSIFLFLAAGIFYLTIIQGNRLRELSDKNCIRLLPQEGSRGRILDRKGEVIVGNSLSCDLMVLPQQAGQPDSLFIKLSRILDKDYEGLKSSFKSNFISSSLPVMIAKNIDMKMAITLEELKTDLSGIIIQSHPLRSYPYGRLACHVVGYLNEIDHWRLTKLADYGYKTKDIVGFGGIEEKYDYYLRQEEGGVSVVVDSKGRLVRQLGFKPPKDGKDIQLTLDLKIQKLIEENLKERKGAIILMSAQNGEIVAMANNPNFAPALFVKNINPAAIGSVLNNPEAPLINRAISGVYPPASVFKLAVAAAGLETGKINLATTFICSGGANIGRRRFSCWDTHGPMNLRAAIAHSCDTFFYKTGLLVGPELIHDYALKFGFTKPTLIELPYEARGFLPHPLWGRFYRPSRSGSTPFIAGKNWFDGDTANFSIGQGDVLVTPLQLTRMMAVFANRGFLVRPYIVKSIDGRDICDYQKKILKVSLKQSTIDYIRQYLRNVVTDPQGTGGVLSGLPVAVAGKTGTAQVASGVAHHGWFLGFFPFNDPRYVICVFLENGGSGTAASILTKQIIERMIQEKLI